MKYFSEWFHPQKCYITERSWEARLFILCGGPPQVVLLCLLTIFGAQIVFFFLSSQTFLLFADLSPFLLSTSFNCCCCIHLFSESINANQIRSVPLPSPSFYALFSFFCLEKWLLGKFIHSLFIKFIWARNLLEFSKLLFLKAFSYFYVPSKNQPSFTIFNRKLAIDKLPFYFNY